MHLNYWEYSSGTWTTKICGNRDPIRLWGPFKSARPLSTSHKPSLSGESINVLDLAISLLSFPSKTRPLVVRSNTGREMSQIRQLMLYLPLALRYPAFLTPRYSEWGICVRVCVCTRTSMWGVEGVPVYVHTCRGLLGLWGRWFFYNPGSSIANGFSLFLGVRFLIWGSCRGGRLPDQSFSGTLALVYNFELHNGQNRHCSKEQFSNGFLKWLQPSFYN